MVFCYSDAECSDYARKSQFIPNARAIIEQSEFTAGDLARLLFKVAVELGKLTHLLAAANDLDDETLRQLHVMCINEVCKINGVIDCEDAVRYQKE